MTNLCNVASNARNFHAWNTRTKIKQFSRIEWNADTRQIYCQSIFHINDSTLHQWFPCQLFETLVFGNTFFFFFYILFRMKKFQDCYLYIYVVYLSVYNKESIYLYLYDITIYHVYNVPSTKVATLYDKTLHM